MSLALTCLLVVGDILPAQERIPLPPPDPGPSVSTPPVSPPQTYVPSPGPTTPPPPYYPTPIPPPPEGDMITPLSTLPVYVPSRAGDPCFWVGAEALIWWTKNPPLPTPVVTTGPASQGFNAGGFGMPGTTSLNEPLHFGAEGGVRISAGGWFDADHIWGMSGSFFILGDRSAGFNVLDRSGTGNFIINEPVSGVPFSTLVSAPGIETGGVNVDATSRLWGVDLNLLYNLYRGSGWTINLLGGYRYLQLEEWLSIDANSTLFTTTTYTDNMGNVLAVAPPGSTISVIDQFKTRNEFNGGQLGAEFQYQWGRVSFGGTAKVALGDTHEAVTINGVTNIFPVNSAPVSLSGGNFATTQIGRYTVDRFAVAPEAQLNVGYQITSWMRTSVGYNFLYLSSVARPGNQIDNSFDGVTHPNVPMTSSTYWSQGLHLSLQLTY
jgi:hypothetical protein